jgi:hypothetical protein
VKVIVVLQPKTIEELRLGWRNKTQVIYQSVEDSPPNMDAGRLAKVRASKFEASERSNGTFDVRSDRRFCSDHCFAY